MWNYYGFLSYPHGGRISAFLLISMACAVVCTCYAVSSCRFLSLDFQSSFGNFDEHFYFYIQEPNGTTTHRVGVGLFHWLRPFDTLDWTEGGCAGYNQLQRDVIVDDMFEALRGVSVIAVLLSISLFLFTLGIACLSFSRIQRYALVGCCWANAAMTGSAFLMTRSGLCTQVGVNPNCSMDQGGLVALAAIVFWMLTSLVAMFFIQPVTNTKLSPKMREQKKKELRLRQLEMLKQLEELELQKRREERSKRRRQSSKERQGKQEAATRLQGEAKCASPERRSSKAPRQQQSAHGSAVDWHSPDSIPKVLPKSAGDKRRSNRKHKQCDSPIGSPKRSSHRRSNSRLEIYEVEHTPEETQVHYSTRMHPVKKRRLLARGRASNKQKGTRASSLIDLELIDDESAGEPSKTKPKRLVRGLFDEETSEATDMAVRDQEESDSLFGRSRLEEKSATKACNPLGCNLLVSHRQSNSSIGDTDFSIPLYMSRDLSTVVNERAVEENVEVYISDRLNKIDDMVADDFEYDHSTGPCSV